MGKTMPPQMFSNHITKLLDRFSQHGQEYGDKLISLIVLVIMLSVTPIGYHIIVLNVPSTVIQRAIADDFRQKYHVELGSAWLNVIWSFLVSCQSIGAFIGCFLVVPMERRFGTKHSLLLLNNLILVLASLAFVLAMPVDVLLLLTVGRLLVGIYTGIGCALVPVYVQELSPHQLKGALCCFVHIAVCAGSALGAFLSLENLLGGPSTWGALLSLPLLLALAQIFLGHFLMETPNFFLRRGQRVEAANSIRFHYSWSEHLDVDTVIRQYQSLVTKMPAQMSLRQAFAEPKVRSQVLFGMAISMAQVFSGSMAAVSYSTAMLQSVSLTAWLTPFIPTLGSVLSIALTIPALRLVESCGRKQLLVNTLGICAVANFLLVLFSLLAQLFAGQQGHRHQSWASFGFLICFFLYGVGYNVGVGPVAYFLPAELVSPSGVSAAMGAATAVNWLASLLTTIVYYPLNETIGGWSFLVFAVPTTLFAIFFHRKLPDAIGDEASENSDNHFDRPLPPLPGTSENPEVPPSPVEIGNGEGGEATTVDRWQQPFSLPVAVERTPLQHQTSATSGGTFESAASTAWYSTFESP